MKQFINCVESWPLLLSFVLHSFYYLSTRPSVFFIHFTCILFFSFQTYPSPTMNYATQMNYKLKKELNDLQYGRQSNAVILRSVLCLLCRVIYFLNKHLFMFVCYFKGLAVQQDGLNLFYYSKPVYITT